MTLTMQVEKGRKHRQIGDNTVSSSGLAWMVFRVGVCVGDERLSLRDCDHIVQPVHKVYIYMVILSNR